jgi:hypothetical protein
MSDIDILTQIERALVSDSQTQRDLAMDGAHVEIQRLRKENAILDKELVRHIRHASELISQVERTRAEAIKECAALMRRWSKEAAEFHNSDRCTLQANVCRNAAVAISNLATVSSDERHG